MITSPDPDFRCLAPRGRLFTKARVHYEGRELKVSKPCPEIPSGALIVLVPPAYMRANFCQGCF